MSRGAWQGWPAAVDRLGELEVLAGARSCIEPIAMFR